MWKEYRHPNEKALKMQTLRAATVYYAQVNWTCIKLNDESMHEIK